jgi:protein-tyrosine phosphatase
MNITETAISSFIDLGLKGKVWFGSSYDTIEKMNKTFCYLKQNNVSVIWNLLEDDTIALSEARHFRTIHSPIVDFSIPEDQNLFVQDVLNIIQLLNNGNNIYIHCFAGHGRTGMAILSLMVLLGQDPKTSLNIVYEKVHGPETEDQITFATSLILVGQDDILD